MKNLKLVVIDRNIASAVAVKQALEGTRRFTVTPFADSFAALDYLRQEAQDVVVVDMIMRDYPGGELIEAVLEIQPETTVFASAADSASATTAIRAGATQLLNGRYTGRELLELLEQTFGEGEAAEDEGEEETPEEELPAPNPEGGKKKRKSSLFERIAAEEPPPPSFEDSGTVTDFIAVSPDQLDEMLNQMVGDDDEAEEPPEDDMLPPVEGEDEDEDDDTPAKLILETANDDTQLLADLPFDQYIRTIRERNQDIRQTYIEEPDFLSDPDFWDNIAIEGDSPLDTIMDRPDAVTEEVPAAAPADESDEDAEAVAEQPTEEEAEPEPAIEPDVEDAAEAEPDAEEEVAEVEAEAEPDVETKPEPTPAEAADEAVEDDDVLRWEALDPEELAESYDDPRITQLAVSLTQASLESTAEATLLTRGPEFIAYEGGLSDADIAEFMEVITDGWEDVGETHARIRYLTLSSNGLDYMVYSRRTHEDFILSMVFAGQTPLRDIRQQGKRIAGALRSVPEAEAEPEIDTEDEADKDETPEAAVTKPSRGGLRLEGGPPALDVPLVEHTFVWLLRDPEAELAYATAEAINAGLRVQLVEKGWRVTVLDVEEDYVYMVAGVPGDVPPQEVVRELQERSARIATKANTTLKPESLWAESYFVLSPGRELNLQEIQQYINFYRM